YVAARPAVPGRRRRVDDPHRARPDGVKAGLDAPPAALEEGVMLGEEQRPPVLRSRDDRSPPLAVIRDLDSKAAWDVLPVDGEEIDAGHDLGRPQVDGEPLL